MGEERVEPNLPKPNAEVTVTTSPTWQMRGEYVENCNCDVICPCAVSQLRARPTQGHCDVVFAFTVQEGNFGDTPLGGLSFVIALYTPGPMGEGNGKLALCLDERANQSQREALEAIARGRAGGAAWRVRQRDSGQRVPWRDARAHQLHRGGQAAQRRGAWGAGDGRGGD